MKRPLIREQEPTIEIKIDITNEASSHSKAKCQQHSKYYSIVNIQCERVQNSVPVSDGRAKLQAITTSQQSKQQQQQVNESKKKMIWRNTNKRRFVANMTSCNSVNRSKNNQNNKLIVHLLIVSVVDLWIMFQNGQATMGQTTLGKSLGSRQVMTKTKIVSCDGLRALWRPVLFLHICTPPID